MTRRRRRRYLPLVPLQVERPQTSAPPERPKKEAKMSAYAKSLTAVIGAIVMAVAAAMTDDKISYPEWVMIAVAGFTAFQVFVTANVGLPLWDKAKAVTAGALAGLGLLGGYLANGEHMTGSLWLNVAIAAATAAGVFAVPNNPAPA